MHVLDASRSVPVVAALISDEQRPGFLNKIQEEYSRIREDHLAHQSDRNFLTLLEAQQIGHI